MRRRQLGTSGLFPSEIGLGCYGLSGAYGPKDPKEFAGVIRKAYDLGVTFFDTADQYGDAETVLGEALSGIRSDVLISTKAGLVTGGKQFSDTSAQHLRSSCEQSLKRLGTDVIDLFNVHYDDPQTPVEDTVCGLEQLRDEGKIRAWGVGHLPVERVGQFLQTGLAASAMLEMNTLALKSYTQVRPMAEQYGSGIIAFSATARGLLTGKITSSTTFGPTDIRSIDPMFHPATMDTALNLVEVLHSTGLNYGKTIAQTAIAWLLAQPGVCCALIGPASMQHLEENLAGGGWSMAVDDLVRITTSSREATDLIRRQRISLAACTLRAPAPLGPRFVNDAIVVAEVLADEAIANHAEIGPIVRRMFRLRRSENPDHTQSTQVLEALRKWQGEIEMLEAESEAQPT